jgi:hypothetical protein
VVQCTTKEDSRRKEVIHMLAKKRPTSMKKVNVSFSFETGKSISENQIANQIKANLGSYAKELDKISGIKIKTVRRVRRPNVAAGYEAKLWEKATC